MNAKQAMRLEGPEPVAHVWQRQALTGGNLIHRRRADSPEVFQQTELAPHVERHGDGGGVDESTKFDRQDIVAGHWCFCRSRIGTRALYHACVVCIRSQQALSTASTAIGVQK